MGIFSFLKRGNEVKEEIKSNFNVVISPTVLNDVKTLLNKQNKTSVRFVVSGMC